MIGDCVQGLLGQFEFTCQTMQLNHNVALRTGIILGEIIVLLVISEV